jgi:hypothetical protein
MLSYIPLLIWHPEDGTSVPKHAGVHICHKWCIKECIFWMIYWCKILTYISCLYSVCVCMCMHTVCTHMHMFTHTHTHRKSQIQLAHKFIRMGWKFCLPIKWWGVKKSNIASKFEHHNNIMSHWTGRGGPIMWGYEITIWSYLCPF